MAEPLYSLRKIGDINTVYYLLMKKRAIIYFCYAHEVNMVSWFLIFFRLVRVVYRIKEMVCQPKNSTLWNFFEINPIVDQGALSSWIKNERSK